jgi:hypothetical protein
MTLINFCSLVTFAIGLKRVVWNNNSDGERFMWIGLGVQLALYPLQILHAHLAAKRQTEAFEANWPAKLASVAGLFGITPTNPATLRLIRDFLPLMPLLSALVSLWGSNTPATPEVVPPRDPEVTSCSFPTAGESNTNWTSPLGPLGNTNVSFPVNENTQPGETLPFTVTDPELTSRLRIYNQNAKIMEEVAAAREARNRSRAPIEVPDTASFATRQAQAAAVNNEPQAPIYDYVAPTPVAAGQTWVSPPLSPTYKRDPDWEAELEAESCGKCFSTDEDEDEEAVNEAVQKELDEELERLRPVLAMVGPGTEARVRENLKAVSPPLPPSWAAELDLVIGPGEGKGNEKAE